LILFGEEGCGLGCWQDLRLGMNDAEATQYFAEYFPEHHDRFEYEGTIYHTGVDIGKFSTQAYMRDDALHAISLGASIGFDLTVQQVIDELGEPTFAFWDYGVAGEIYDAFPYIILYYPEQGYIFHFDMPRKRRNARTANEPVTICPTPDTHVGGIHIVHPSTIESIIRYADHFTVPSQVERRMNNLVAWEGYECRTFGHQR